MALINAANFGKLSAISVSTAPAKTPVTFFNVFITGKPRGKMRGYMYQCPAAFTDSNDKFFVLNQDEVVFLPLYVRKYWAKYERKRFQDGNEGDVTVAFGWKEDAKKPEGAKTEYLVAGYLCDEHGKTVKHDCEIDGADIKVGDPVLVYFRCKGWKCDSAFKFLDACNKMVDSMGLKPLSDDPTFEKAQINHHRFLVKATIEQKDSQYGPQSVFKFTPVQDLKEEMVERLLNDANNVYMDKFDKQFDRSEFVSASAAHGDTETTDVHSAPVPTVQSVDVPEVTVDDNPGENFSIEI